MNPIPEKKSVHRTVLILAGISGLVLWIFRSKLTFDPVAYAASFADQETHFGIQNFWNVTTNLGFAILGVYGLNTLQRFPLTFRTLATIFTLAILATALGSSYFHYAPTAERLFWDELPMSIGFASFTGMVIADRASPKMGLWAGLGLCLLGPWSVWNIYYGNGDTTFYIALQFGSLLFSILVLLFARVGNLRSGAIFVGLFAYLFAKILESNDRAVFEKFGFLSGHSLKHIAAAISLAAIFYGSQKRQPLKSDGI